MLKERSKTPKKPVVAENMTSPQLDNPISDGLIAKKKGIIKATIPSLTDKNPVLTQFPPDIPAATMACVHVGGVTPPSIDQ